MEQSSSGNWYSGTPTVAWVTGYSSSSPAAYSCALGEAGFLADYGDDVLGGSGNADSWTVAEVYQVAWGISSACALPEIYYPGMASEWQALSQWGAANASTGAIVFTGVMTEAVSGSYSPTTGWQQLQSFTGQSAPALTDIGTSLQGPPPEIGSVSPNNGQESGGTQVTINGSNLLGLQAVYFGGVPATSFAGIGADSLTAVAPPESPGTVNIEVETSRGTSSNTPSDLFQYVPPPCTAVNVSASTSPAAPGYSLPVTAQATCPTGATPEYSYFVRPVGSSSPWTLEAAWIGPSWTWNTAGLSPGSYQVLAWAADGPYGPPQVEGLTTVTLSTVCSAVTVTAPSAGTPGEVVPVTAQATCPTGATPEYSYFVRPVGSSSPWTLEAAWVGPSWTWNTARLSPGSYQVLVWASGGPYGAPQVQGISQVNLAWYAACSAVSVTAPATSNPSADVSITAQATCPTGATPEYSYFVRPVGSSSPWTLEAAWIGPSWTWNTAGLSLGSYQVLVWASDGPYATPQVQSISQVTLAWPAACSAVSVTAPATSNPSADVSITAQATCPTGATPEYSYFVRPVGDTGPWTLEAAWIGPTWTWNTAGLSPGSYQVLVWASDGPYATPQVEATATSSIG